MQSAEAVETVRIASIPSALPEMVMKLLPEHQRQPAKLEELEPAPSAD